MLALVFATTPQRCFATTLRDAIALAYQTNPELRAQRAELRAMDEQYVQAKAGFGPQLGITGGVSAEAARVSVGAGIFGSANKRNYRGGTTTTTISAVQPLYTSGQLTARLGEAEATVFLNRQTLRQAESRTLLAVVSAYMDVQRDRAVLAVLDGQVASMKSDGDEAQARGRAGQITKTDVSLAESRFISAQLQRQTAAARLESSEASYLEVVGEAPGVLQDEAPLAGLPPTLDDALSAAEANNAEVLAALAAEQVARRRVDVARAATGPNLSLRFDASVGPTEPYLQHSYQKSAAGSVIYSVPLFAAGANGARVRQAMEEDKRAMYAAEAQRRKAIGAASRAWSGLADARRSYALQTSQIQAQEEVLKGERIELRAGQRPLTELLNASAEVTSGRIGRLQSRRDEFVAQATLLAAMGLLEARVQTPGVDLYDPAASLRSSERKVFAPLQPVIQAIELTAAPRSAPPRTTSVRLGRDTTSTPAMPGPQP